MLGDRILPLMKIPRIRVYSIQGCHVVEEQMVLAIIQSDYVTVSDTE